MKEMLKRMKNVCVVLSVLLSLELAFRRVIRPISQSSLIRKSLVLMTLEMLC